ncbi:barstar family protein [Rouxiella sp. Mn2063]|uniref:barstar family protein n=1 Tax=Rouxiella sp. Mn2063 TaxID=3395262 RepID=UPI003BEE0143
MSKNDIMIDGSNIYTESQFHSILAELLNFGPYYGHNLDALWDRLSTDVERPVNIIWTHSDLSKQRLGDYFNKIIQIFERTKQQDIKFSWDDKFDYILK